MGSCLNTNNTNQDPTGAKSSIEKKKQQLPTSDQQEKPKPADDNSPKSIKVVLVGDTSVGKTCLIRNYLNNEFSEDYEPTVLDLYSGTKNIRKKQI